ncbi:MAG: M23 family metallopeptidase [Actinomycetota bacterium]|nr:M23 family metallopeptidase [Actinomycetota bacterium]
MPAGRRWRAPIAAAAVLGGGIAVGVAGTVLTSQTATAPTTSSTTVPSTTTTVPATTTTAPADRPIGPVAHAPLATVGDLTLLHPAGRVERVGFHESTLDGALELTPLPTAVQATTLNTRARGHGPHTAVDVVSDPTGAVRAPVTGTVIAAGGYQLYCAHHDDTVVIVPDGHPTWYVRVLHIDGVRVVPGWRVEAGVTVIAARPRALTFRSQIDRLAANQPAWPHVHVEVDDNAVPDTPSKGDSC